MNRDCIWSREIHMSEISISILVGKYYKFWIYDFREEICNAL